jgi:hypothetical protein
MWPRVQVMVSGQALDLVVGSAQQLDRRSNWIATGFSAAAATR